MVELALLYITVSGILGAIMFQTRKKYQIVNGIGPVSTLSFLLLTSLFSAVMGGFLSDGLRLELYSFLFATGYALVSIVTTAICICGTAYGNLSVLIMYATLGSMVIPSVYGLVVLPEENVLTVWKNCGMVAAFLCLMLNFWSARNKKSVKSTAVFKVLCAVVFFTNGSALVIFNLENRYCSGYSYYSFMTESMLISVAMLIIAMLVLCFFNCKKFIRETGQLINVKNFKIILTYALLSLATNLLSLNCADMIPLTIQAPLSFCVPVIVTAILDYMLYKEKLTKKDFLQMIVACVCCICFVIE